MSSIFLHFAPCAVPRESQRSARNSSGGSLEHRAANTTMRPAIVSLALFGAATADTLQRRDCAANNCIRAVRGSNGLPDQSSKRQDCSSFVATTITPAAV